MTIHTVAIHPDTPVLYAARLAAISGYKLKYDSQRQRVVLQSIDHRDPIVGLIGRATYRETNNANR